MDSTTSALIACAGLAVGIVALAVAWSVARGARRRADAHLDQMAAVEQLLTQQVAHEKPSGVPVATAEADHLRAGQVRALPTRAPDVRDELVELEDADEIIDAEIVDHQPAPVRPGTLVPRASAATPQGVAQVASLVVRHSVVRGASVVHGLRHGLSGRTRNRIRYEMGVEVKRSRRERKDEVRVALREYRARQRARVAASEADGENVG